MITRSSGFSLVELLVVVAIVGIISAVATIAYTGYISSAKASAAKNLMAQIALAQSEEYANSGSYFKTDSTAECRPGAPGTSDGCLLYTSPSPRDKSSSRMPSSA